MVLLLAIFYHGKGSVSTLKSRILRRVQEGLLPEESQRPSFSFRLVTHTAFLRMSPTTLHCGHSATVRLSVSNPRTKATIQSVVFMWEHFSPSWIEQLPSKQ